MKMAEDIINSSLKKKIRDMTEYKLRPIKTEDLDSLVLHANNKKIARYMTNRFPHPYTHEDGKNFIDFCMADNGSYIMAIDLNGSLVGAVGIHQQDDVMKNNAELGYWIAEQYWNKGIITNAVREMIEWAFQNLSINRVFARPYGSNLASQRVLDKLGFVKEAQISKNIEKWGEFEDELIYAIRKKTP
jgi:ribosomal-protein-alanine N-acetyltransferase